MVSVLQGVPWKTLPANSTGSDVVRLAEETKAAGQYSADLQLFKLTPLRNDETAEHIILVVQPTKINGGLVNGNTQVVPKEQPPTRNVVSPGNGHGGVVAEDSAYVVHRDSPPARTVASPEIRHSGPVADDSAHVVSPPARTIASPENRHSGPVADDSAHVVSPPARTIASPENRHSGPVAESRSPAVHNDSPPARNIVSPEKTPVSENKAEAEVASENATAGEVVSLEKIHGGLVGENSAQVVVHDEDPTACYLAAQTWDDLKLSKEIMDGIYEMGFTRPSKIQEVALPITMKGKNLVGQAQNGSGKTAAFSLAIISACDVGYKNPQAICLCPTRELALQNHAVIAKLGKYTGLTQFLAIPQSQGTRPPKSVEDQIICGTPGKFHDLLKRRTIESRYLRIFVLDEADVMINEENQMGSEVFRIRKMMPPELQVLLFSATWPEAVRTFASKMVPNSTKIEVKKEDLTLDTITQMYINCGKDAAKKTEVLCDMYAAMNIGQSIIFVNSRKDAFELAQRTKADGHAVSLICGTQKTGPEKVDTSYRDKVMDEFRRGVTKVLISTDVLARGIDVPAVTLVINFQLPVAFQNRNTPEKETYMHRIGRTGRFGLKGIAINFVTESEMPLLEKIKQHYRCSIEELPQDVELLEQRLKKLR